MIQKIGMHQQICLNLFQAYSQAKEVTFVHFLLPYPLDGYLQYAQKVQRGNIQVTTGKKQCLSNKTRSKPVLT